jgi:hypothetical protein
MLPPTIRDLETVFRGLVSSAILLTGVAVLIMLLVGGFQYLSAGGDKEAAQRASRTIGYSIGGLVMVLSAWIIINLLGQFLGADFSTFSICLPGRVC